MDIEDCEYITDLSQEEVIILVINFELEMILNTDKMWAILTGEKDGDTKETER